MPYNVTQQLIESHLLEGSSEPGTEIGLRIDQTLTQDATGTLVMLELHSMGLAYRQTELSAQYVDHNLLQEDNKNPDDHLFLYSAAQRYGLWYSRPGNGVSHPVHQERFGIPGKTLLGSDSHTCAAGGIGMLAIGTGGLDVALAIAGRPYYVKMPKVWGVELRGELPEWVSAKDVILELLRRHGVKGAVNCVLEYYGSGLQQLSAMDRHVIANMGTELGATTTVFPADDAVRRFLAAQGREEDFRELVADDGADYDRHETIDLSELEPLIAMPSSPGNVKPVRDVAGAPIYQSYIGSSANPGYRDFAVPAEVVKGRSIPDQVSFDVNPTSRQLLATLARDGHLVSLIQAGARIHQAGCNGCIGMGQAPATDRISLRTVPRNFPGRSGTVEDKVCLVSPETAVASALKGVITDPRDLAEEGVEYPRIDEPTDPIIMRDMLEPPLPEGDAEGVALEWGPNIVALPEFDSLPDTLDVRVLLRVGDDISTDEIMPAGARVLPFRSNIPEISKFCFENVMDNYHHKAMDLREDGGHAIVGGENYGQGSSREHAALAPRYLGLRAVLAKSFARIHWQNLVNFGVLPLTIDAADYDRLNRGVRLRIENARGQIQKREGRVMVEIADEGGSLTAGHQLSERQVEVLLRGGLIKWASERIVRKTAPDRAAGA